MTRTFLLGAVLAWPAAAMPTVDFVGVLTCGRETQVRLVDRDTGTAAWIGEGGAFQGFTLKAYDPAAAEVTLVRREREVRLTLPRARVLPAATPSLETVAAIRANLQRLASAARGYFRAQGAHYVSASELIGPGKEIPELVSVAGEDYASVSLMKGEAASLSVTTATGERVWLAEAATSLPAL